MVGLNTVIMAESSWRSSLIQRMELTEKVTAGEIAPKISSKRTVPPTGVAFPGVVPSPSCALGKKTIGNKQKNPPPTSTASKKPKGKVPSSRQVVVRVPSSPQERGKNQEETPLLLSGVARPT